VAGEQERAGEVACFLFEFVGGEASEVFGDGFFEVEVFVGLGEEPDVDLAADFCFARGGGLLAEEASDDGGFASAVGADDSEAVAAFDGGRRF